MRNGYDTRGGFRVQNWLRRERFNQPAYSYPRECSFCGEAEHRPGCSRVLCSGIRRGSLPSQPKRQLDTACIQSNPFKRFSVLFCSCSLMIACYLLRFFFTAAIAPPLCSLLCLLLQVCAPLYPKSKTEAWWVVVGDKKTNSLLAIKRVTLQRKTRAKLEFAAPDEVSF